MGMLKFKEHRLLASCTNQAPDPGATDFSVVPTVNVADTDTGRSVLLHLHTVLQTDWIPKLLTYKGEGNLGEAVMFQEVLIETVRLISFIFNIGLCLD